MVMPEFSRPANSSPLGKCTERLTTDVPPEIKDDFVTYANLHGMTTSELLRDVVIELMRGRMFMLRSSLQRGHGIGSDGNGEES